MAEIDRPRHKVRRAAVLTSHGLAHSVNGAQVKHEVRFVYEDLAAELTHHLTTAELATHHSVCTIILKTRLKVTMESFDG